MKPRSHQPPPAGSGAGTSRVTFAIRFRLNVLRSAKPVRLLIPKEELPGPLVASATIRTRANGLREGPTEKSANRGANFACLHLGHGMIKVKCGCAKNTFCRRAVSTLALVASMSRFNGMCMKTFIMISRLAGDAYGFSRGSLMMN